MFCKFTTAKVLYHDSIADGIDAHRNVDKVLRGNWRCTAVAAGVQAQRLLSKSVLLHAHAALLWCA